jgi:hypothetical protein
VTLFFILLALFNQGEELGRMSVADLLRLTNGSDDPVARLNATRELFHRGPAVLPALEAAGAKPMSTIAPRRGDVVYSLIHGISVLRGSSNLFGIHLEGSVTRDDVQQMGRRRGFHLEPADPFHPGAAPTCYVHLSPGKDLVSVLKDILLTEPNVKTVNLNYVEK